MPAYDYLCDETGEMLEVIKPMTEAPKIGHRLRRNGKTFRRIPPGKVVANVAPEYS
jgi:predicted nucleic acid-binding Zn ribbon protein